MARGIFELQINNLEFQFVLYSPKFSKVTYCQAGAASLTESMKKQEAGHQVRCCLQVTPVHYGRRIPDLGKQAFLVAAELIFSACA